MNTLIKNINSLFLTISSFLFLYTLYILISTVNKGFDITDQSYYILKAKYQSDMVSVLAHEGYITGVLYKLSGFDLGLFRLYGILILAAASIWFAYELYRYITDKFKYDFKLVELMMFIVPISTGAMSFYNRWLITPSYNWVAILSVIIVFALLFRLAYTKTKHHFHLNIILLSLAYNLSFAGKPTTTIALLLISIFFICFEIEKINIKKTLLWGLLYNIIFLLIHIFLIDNNYFYRTMESLEILKSLGGGYSFSDTVLRTFIYISVYLLKKLYIYEIEITYILLFCIIILLFYFYRDKKSIKNLFIPFVILSLSIYIYFIYIDFLREKTDLMWLYSMEILFFIIAVYFINKLLFQKSDQTQSSLKLFIISFILVSGSIAYRFGTNIHFVLSLASGLMFVYSAILVYTFYIDKMRNNTILTSFVGILLSLFVVHQILFVYEKPYRVIESIDKQIYKVNFRNNKNYIYVDEKTAEYFNDLKEISSPYIVNDKRLYLLDLSGGSPGANVILDAKTLGAPWLLGSYKGSNQFAYNILKKFDKEKLKNSWLLIAPKGRRSLDLEILKKLNLNFPEAYKKIGTVTTSHRNEFQEIWVPKAYLDVR